MPKASINNMIQETQHDRIALAHFMEMFNDRQLQVLTEKTWDLHARLNEKINQEGFSLCSHCSNHGRYCVVAEKTMEEMGKIIAIRDSLKDLHNILVYLQTEKSCQKTKSDEALGRLEASRMHLVELLTHWREKEGRKHLVLEELKSFLGDKKMAIFKGKMNEKIEKHENMNGIYGFVVNSIRFGMEFLVMFASISSAVQLYRWKQKNDAIFFKTEIEASVDSTRLDLVTTDSKGHLDVLYGRG